MADGSAPYLFDKGPPAVYHELSKDGSCESDVERSALAEVDDDHLVGCVRLGN
jgi:hypothetical protein